MPRASPGCSGLFHADEGLVQIAGSYSRVRSPGYAVCCRLIAPCRFMTFACISPRRKRVLNALLTLACELVLLEVLLHLGSGVFERATCVEIGGEREVARLRGRCRL